MGSPPKSNHGDFRLSETHRMLLRMRDTLYEGSWEDFARDLRARAQDRPHIFETVPTSQQMKSTIATHLSMIDLMQEWETDQGCTLSADDPEPERKTEAD